MTDYVIELEQSIRNVAFDELSDDEWSSLELCMKKWRDPDEGGVIGSTYVDDNLERFLANKAQILRGVYHISKLSPSNKTRGAIIEASRVFARIVSAIERAVIVARIRGDAVKERESQFDGHVRSDSMSPVPKCK